MHIDEATGQVSIFPYEKETPYTRFCDGVLVAVNSSFQTKKQEFLDALNEREYDSLLDVAHFLSVSPYLPVMVKQPFSLLYSLCFDVRTHRLYWQEVARL